MTEPVYAVETFAQIIGDLKPLMDLHWRELALYQDAIPLDPDYAIYEAVEKAGSLIAFSVRLDGALIGYAVYLARRHPHYRQHVWANSDIFWLHPDHRRGRTGSRLFTFVEKELAARGVDVMHTTFKTDHPAAGVVLEHLGHKQAEIGFSKRLR